MSKCNRAGLVIDSFGVTKEALALTKPKAEREATAISLDCQANPFVNCNDVEIEQVLINLINNAVDAAKEEQERWV